MLKKLFILLILALSFRLYADENNLLFESAGQSYSKGDYKKSIELYNKILAGGYESYKVYYNLGNAYFKTKDLPSAILFYEKALKLKPGDEDIMFNLKVANTRISDKIDAIPELFFKRWWKSLYGIFSADMWAKITIAVFIAFLIFLLVYLLAKSLSVKKLSFWFSMIFFISAVFAYILAGQQHRTVNNTKEAIIFYPALTVKSSPDNNSTDLFVIHEGLKVRITDKIGGWYEIRIPDGNKGWVESSMIKII